jgi:hypothetical protein
LIKQNRDLTPYIGGGKIMKKYLLLMGACVLLGSCSNGDAPAPSVLLLGRSSQALVFLNYRAVSEDEVEFMFSEPVKITSLNFEPAQDVASIDDGSTTVRVKLDEQLQPGISLTVDLLAEDPNKNTINVLFSFRSRNNRMPALVINELRTEYSNPRAEFVEFVTKSAGNLGGMRVFIAGGSQKPSVYEFSPIEVAKDEYIVLHLRKMEEANKDEYTSIAESGGRDSSLTARDFWIPDTIKLINKTAGFVYVLDQDDRVLDAIMISEKADKWWTKDYLAEAAEFLHGKGAWTAPGGNICTPADAINSTGTTLTRTICRDENAEDTNTAAVWYVTVTSGGTPGAPNNSNRYLQ